MNESQNHSGQHDPACVVTGTLTIAGMPALKNSDVCFYFSNTANIDNGLTGNLFATSGFSKLFVCFSFELLFFDGLTPDYLKMFLLKIV